MPRYRADVTFYFDADEGDVIPRRLHALSAAAQTEGFDLNSAKVEPGTEPPPDADGWTPYAPLDD